ncbi:hypothetical protein G7K_6627-t1 [Saitoella complicata NRRL Y-17804]|uniref:Protein transport protein Sec61 subunit gamma n=1 Tax=Saitoella complicata (strain BCRC 22490 / CBS 7301 / JCM 7358 / NBRC 10748 / NRRL Y-17804) TaxID=698492 RepID=A0A0E9NS17_SAICN|nr:hypothetical protein G7K_6627-t1 [Saitoella complicata NRRL Y-17804]
MSDTNKEVQTVFNNTLSTDKPAETPGAPSGSSGPSTVFNTSLSTETPEDKKAAELRYEEAINLEYEKREGVCQYSVLKVQETPPNQPSPPPFLAPKAPHTCANAQPAPHRSTSHANATTEASATPTRKSNNHTQSQCQTRSRNSLRCLGNFSVMEVRCEPLPSPACRYSVLFINRCTKPDKKEFIMISKAVAIGFLVMGFIGFIVKLIHIPINNILYVEGTDEISYEEGVRSNKSSKRFWREIHSDGRANVTDGGSGSKYPKGWTGLSAPYQITNKQNAFRLKSLVANNAILSVIPEIP